jgi:uncharacterized membrane protein YdjX (TVP38/TMEM64 family)
LKAHTREILRNPLVIATAASFAAALVLTLVWTATPLRTELTPERASHWITSLAQEWWTPWLMFAAFVLGNLIVFPRPLLTVAAVVAYGAWQGFAISMAGAEVATFIGYSFGRMCPRESVEQLAGSTLARFEPIMHRNGVVAMSLLRLLPLGPHVMGSVVAGALRFRPWHVFAGTFIGMTPGILASVLVGQQIAAGMSPDGHANQWILWGTVIAIVVLIAGTRVWYERVSRAAPSPSSPPPATARSRSA